MADFRSLRLPLFRLGQYDGNMSFSETIFLFFLALIVFGPKKLPEIARQAGKLLAELRRASNEFKSQIEQEISHLETEKSQTILPPVHAPEGSVASRSLNARPAEPGASEPATLAASETDPPATSSNGADPARTTEASTGADSVPSVASQEFHA